MDIETLVKIIIDCARMVRAAFSPGFEEKIYKNAMLVELRHRGLSVETEVPFTVYYKDTPIGHYKADIIVEKQVVVELKAVSSIIPIHEVQLVNHLNITGIETGLLINFGADAIQIKRMFKNYCKPLNSQS